MKNIRSRRKAQERWEKVSLLTLTHICTKYRLYCLYSPPFGYVLATYNILGNSMLICSLTN